MKAQVFAAGQIQSKGSSEGDWHCKSEGQALCHRRMSYLAQFIVPTMALTVIDRAIQAFGAEGVSQDQDLAYMYASLRTLRIADGPDAVRCFLLSSNFGITDSGRCW